MSSIKDLQVQLPWTTHYHKDFRSSPMTHKDFGHALLHVLKAAGKLAAVVNDAEHGGSEFKSEEVNPYIADLVVCALRMANTCPGGVVDLEAAVIDRLEKKNGVSIHGTLPGADLRLLAIEAAARRCEEEHIIGCIESGDDHASNCPGCSLRDALASSATRAAGREVKIK